MASADPNVLAELRQLDVGCSFPAGNQITQPDLEAALCARLNWLLHHDFHRLIFLLYRADIPETKLREALSKNRGEDSAPLLTAFFLERLAEKAKSRVRFSQQPGKDAADDEEKW